MTVAEITMVELKSSNIKRVGHDPARNELHVHFANGGRYVYSNVHRVFYQKLLEAKSPGKYLASSIKDVFQARKL